MRSTPPLFVRWSRSLLLGAGFVSLATLAACRSDTGPGSAVVTYELGNNKTCAEVGVTDIQVWLFRGSFDEPSSVYTEMIPCDDGEVIIESVDPNTYEVRVAGYDDTGVAIFDNLGQIASERVVEVFDAAESSHEAELTARPADLKVRWRLGDGGFGNCSGVGIDRFEIKAYQVEGGTLMLEHTLDCDLIGDSQGFRLVPDPNRELNGVQFGEVGIQALDASGADVGTPATFVFDPVGPGYPVELTIECTSDGCIAP